MPIKKTKKNHLVVKHSEKFAKEIKKSISTALVAAFGFIIALTWRDVITLYVGLLTSINPISGKIVEALIVTIISVLGILIVTRFLSVKEE